MLSGILMSFDKDAPKVLLYIENGSSNLQYMLQHEVGVMKDILEKSGFNVEVATIDGLMLKTDSMSLQPDMKLSDVKVIDYVGFIMPCMAAEDTTVTQTEIDFVRNVMKENKPIAAQLGAVLILAKAGALDGKKYAVAEEIKNFKGFSKGQYSGEGVVKDGNLITSGVCPNYAREAKKKDGTAELTNTLVAVIKDNK
jgi:putative intracellular protease/amidase